MSPETSKTTSKKIALNLAYVGAIGAFVLPIFISVPALLIGLWYCTKPETRKSGIKVVCIWLVSGFFGYLSQQPPS